MFDDLDLILMVLTRTDYSNAIPEEEVYKELGITPEDLADADEVEIE